jgi:hypothetical protein
MGKILGEGAFDALDFFFETFQFMGLEQLGGVLGRGPIPT